MDIELDGLDRTLRWLLEESQPSVRYRALTELLGLSPEDQIARKARTMVMSSQLVTTILDHQNKHGGWDSGPNWYKPKYKSSVWRLLLLSQLGVDIRDDRVKKACEYAFRFQLPGGAFVTEPGDEKSWASAAGCLNGNIIASLSRLGCQDDPRVVAGLDALISIQESDGGFLCRSWKAHAKDTHSCFMGSISGLEAINSLFPYHESSELREAGERAAEFFLMHKLYLADHHDWKIIKERWTRLGWPYFADYDILRGLLAVLDMQTLRAREDERILPAVDLLVSKRTTEGSWNLEKTYSAMGVTIESRHAPSKFCTLLALKALKAFNPNAFQLQEG
jgi:hypothetical protein